jgi:hypothetical protein
MLYSEKKNIFENRNKHIAATAAAASAAATKTITTKAEKQQ